MRALTFALALITSFVAHATPENDPVEVIRKKLTACRDKKENQSIAGKKGCELEAFQAADDELNLQWKQIMVKIDDIIAYEKKENTSEFEAYGEETKKRLIAAQRAWITFRDAQCVFEGSYMMHGTGEGLIIATCLKDMTLKRLSELIEIREEGM